MKKKQIEKLKKAWEPTSSCSPLLKHAGTLSNKQAKKMLKAIK